MSLNWFIPALVNIRVGSFLMTIGAEGTTVWPFDLKKSRYIFLISFDVISDTLYFYKITVGTNFIF